MFEQFEYFRTKHVLDMVAFSIDKQTICNERVYLRVPKYRNVEFQRYTFDGICEILYHTFYADTGKTKLEVLAKLNSEKELFDLFEKIETCFPVFKKHFLQELLLLEEVNASHLIIAFNFDAKMMVERISLYLWPRTSFAKLISKDTVKLATFHDLLRPGFIGTKFTQDGVYCKAYFVRKKETIHVEDKVFHDVLKILGHDGVDAPFANYHFFGIGLPLDVHAGNRVAVYFYPKRVGIHTMQLKSNAIVRHVGGKTFLIDQKKRYDKNPDITMVNTMGSAICDILAKHEMRTTDYIADLIALEVDDYDGSVEYYGKIYNMVIKFAEDLEKINLLEVWRD